jgi:hypothetical protein
MTQAMTWEIYGVGETTDVGWSWRCHRNGAIMRRGVFMFSNMQDALEDAVANGMDVTLHGCSIVGIDGVRAISQPSEGRSASPMLSHTAEHAFDHQRSAGSDLMSEDGRASTRA